MFIRFYLIWILVFGTFFSVINHAQTQSIAPKTAKDFFDQGLRLLQEKKPEEAIPSFLQISQLDAKQPA